MISNAEHHCFFTGKGGSSAGSKRTKDHTSQSDQESYQDSDSADDGLCPLNQTDAKIMTSLLTEGRAVSVPLAHYVHWCVQACVQAFFGFFDAFFGFFDLHLVFSRSVHPCVRIFSRSMHPCVRLSRSFFSQYAPMCANFFSQYAPMCATFFLAVCTATFFLAVCTHVCIFVSSQYARMCAFIGWLLFIVSSYSTTCTTSWFVLRVVLEWSCTTSVV